jgi:hypothetical protein
MMCKCQEEVRKDIAVIQKQMADHIEEEAIKADGMFSMIRCNTEAIKDLTKNCETILTLQRDIQGAARIGSGVKDFLMWTGKLGVLGSLFAAGVMYVLDRFKDGG